MNVACQRQDTCKGLPLSQPGESAVSFITKVTMNTNTPEMSAEVRKRTQFRRSADPEETMNTKTEPKQTFNSGATRSDRTGKGRYDLIPYEGLRRLAIRYEEGAVVHGDRNWEGGYPISRCIDGAMRHLSQANAGMTDEDHLAAAAWNIFAAMTFQDRCRSGTLIPNYNDLGKEDVLCG